MSELLKIVHIKKSGKVISYEHQVTDGLARFIQDQLYCKYNVNIENVPDSIAVIPFLANVLPFIWLTNSIVEVDEIDRDFFECINNVRKGYKEMYPMLSWGGGIKTSSIIDNSHLRGLDNKAIQLFSGVVDAYTTFFKHYEENPDFITVWGGGDVNIEDTNGWNNVSSHIKQVAKEYERRSYFIKSNFLEFLNISNLNQIVKSSNDQWWHGFQHGLALTGLSAPISMGYRHLYIASTYPKYLKGKYTCASDPLIDNNIKFCGVDVIHDGYEFDRQEKVRYLVKQKRKSFPIELRVCWESSGGSNCCRCEKCYRTILEIVSEGGDPNEMGFRWHKKDIKRCKHRLSHVIRTTQNNILFLRAIIGPMKKQKNEGKIGTEYDWFINLDFDNFNNLTGKAFFNFKGMRGLRCRMRRIIELTINYKKRRIAK